MAADNVKRITTEEEYEVFVQNAERGLIYFRSADAAPCAQMDGVVSTLQRKYDAIAFRAVDVDVTKWVVRSLQVKHVPSVHLIAGGRVVDRLTGVSAAGVTRRVAWLSTSDAKAQLDAAVHSAQRLGSITLFMKGNPDMPRCGFSRQIVELFRSQGIEEYAYVDILKDQGIRQRTKEIANWPTYPQIYAGGTFIGGLDIAKELVEAGELKKEIEMGLLSGEGVKYEVFPRLSSSSFVMKKEQDGEEEKPSMWIAEYFTPYDVYHHGVRELLCSSKTKFQNMTIADTGAYGRALFLDSRVQTTEGDEAFYHEPLVHTPVVLSNRTRSVRKVLVLGGADGGAAREALRWRGVQRVVVVDIDGEVVDACRKYLARIHAGCWEDERCELVIGDALDYIKQSDELFDVVVSDLTDPVEHSPILELFTVEHFENVRRRLTPGGVLALQGGAISLVECDLFPRVCRTLADVFKCVLPAQVFVPTYGSPLALAFATDASDVLPPVQHIDNDMDTNLNGELKVLDGRGVHAMFAVPKCVSKAIKNVRESFTKANIVDI